ncbi:hypothetical protein WA026_015731 [Henosepilachna vigintioctopunctata]|uniref:Uncharacterized protein n=1 Tax=Henosepilachna vigintioctopunctata TaxID=420089 RepID=A0AAW1UYN7_9CUCU
MDYMKKCLDTLNIYKTLSVNPENHDKLLRKRTPLLYPATMLESENLRVVELSQDILENFIANERNHSFIMSTFGIYEALKSLSKKNIDGGLSKRAACLIEILENSYSSQTYATRNRAKIKFEKPYRLCILDLKEINPVNKYDIECTLVETKGVVSFTIDIDKKRCTLRLCPRTKIYNVVKKLRDKCNITAVVITDNKKQRDIHNESYSSLENSVDEGVAKNNRAITSAINFIKTSNSYLQSITNYWNESFYW